jgi:hypothetical protein
MENLLVGTLILGLVFACCGTSDFASYADCGVDGYSCLESAAINDCSPARSLLADDIPMEAKITGQYDSSSCYMEIRTLSKSEMKDLFRSEGADEATIQMYESMYGDYYSNFADKKASCVVSATYVEEFLSYGDFEDYCTGELVDSFQYY